MEIIIGEGQPVLSLSKGWLAETRKGVKHLNVFPPDGEWQEAS